MRKKDYQAPDVELIGLTTYDICDVSIRGFIYDTQIDWGGVDDGTNDPDVNRWDKFDDKFEY